MNDTASSASRSVRYSPSRRGATVLDPFVDAPDLFFRQSAPNQNVPHRPADREDPVHPAVLEARHEPDRKINAPAGHQPRTGRHPPGRDNAPRKAVGFVHVNDVGNKLSGRSRDRTQSKPREIASPHPRRAHFQRGLPRSPRQLPSLIREDADFVAEVGLALGGQKDLILPSAPFGRGIDMENPHEGRETSSALSFANFWRTYRALRQEIR